MYDQSVTSHTIEEHCVHAYRASFCASNNSKQDEHGEIKKVFLLYCKDIHVHTRKASLFNKFKKERTYMFGQAMR